MYNLKYVLCVIGVRHWEDGTVNGKQDTENGDNIPLKDGDYWKIKIDIDTGIIEGWDKTKTARIHYKSCDNNAIEVYDTNDECILFYDGYVPSFLYPKDEGFGDYVILNIDETGKIENWNRNLVLNFFEKIKGGN